MNSNNIFPSYLNTVAATSGDLDTSVAGFSIITGLPPIQDNTVGLCTSQAYAAGTAGVYRVNSASIANSTNYYVTVTWFNPTMSQVVNSTFHYLSDASATPAEFQTAFHSWLDATIIASAGYTFANVSTDKVDITAPKNYPLVVAINTTLSGSGLTVTNTAGAVPQVGLGSDIIATYGWPESSSSSANDGIYPTGNYHQFFIPVNVPNQNNPASGFTQYTCIVYIIDGTNGDALLSSLETNFGI